MTREQLVVELLRLRAEGLQDVKINGIHGDGGSVQIRSHAVDCRLRVQGLRCTCWVKSLDELAAGIRLMMAGGRRSTLEPWTDEAKAIRRQWSNLHRRWVVAERRPRMVKVRAGLVVAERGMEPLGLVNRLALDKRGNGSCRMLCETWCADVDEQLAWQGARWLASAIRGPLNLPRELLVKDAA